MQLSDREKTNTSRSSMSGTTTSTHGGTLNKPKNYKIKNADWYCKTCDVYCNSKSQYEVHLMSIKHGEVASEMDAADSQSQNVDDAAVFAANLNDSYCCSLVNSQPAALTFIKDENNNTVPIEYKRKMIDINNFDLANQFNVDAAKYLIPAEKKIGKFEKFGFYCKKCDAYMTGQIQLVMHVKGAKHQYFSPGELPNYKPNKVYNPGRNMLRKANTGKNHLNKHLPMLNVPFEPQPPPFPFEFKKIDKNVAYNSTFVKENFNGLILEYIFKNTNFHNHHNHHQQHQQQQYVPVQPSAYYAPDIIQQPARPSVPTLNQTNYHIMHPVPLNAQTPTIYPDVAIDMSKAQPNGESFFEPDHVDRNGAFAFVDNESERMKQPSIVYGSQTQPNCNVPIKQEPMHQQLIFTLSNTQQPNAYGMISSSRTSSIHIPFGAPPPPFHFHHPLIGQKQQVPIPINNFQY